MIAATIISNSQINSAKRWDFEYFDPEYVHALSQLRSSSWPIKRLVEIVEVITDGQHGYLEHLPQGIPLLRTSNVFEYEIRLDDVRYISPEVHTEVKRSQLKPGDVLLTTIGSVGLAAVVEPMLGEANINQNLVKITPSRFVNSHYLAIFLNSRLGRIQTLRTASKSVVPIVNYSRLREILVPLPPRPVQDRIARIMQAAYATRQAKLAEAQALLEGIDGYVFGELNIFPEAIPEQTRFLKRASKIHRGRFDVEFNMGFHKFDSAEHLVRPVEEVALFSTEIKDPTLEPEVPFCYIDIASIDVQSGEIVDVKEIIGRDAPSRARQIVHSGDIVVSTVRPTRGATAIVADHMDSYICSTGFAVVRANGRVLPEYLHIALRLSTTREQLGRRSSGSSYPAVLIKDIKETLIPVPDKEVQETIVAEVKKRKAVANQLRNAAQALVTQAKQQVERLILGEEIV